MSIPAKTETINGYADRVMALINADMDAKIVPVEVRSWAGLEAYVDANGYITEALVPWGTDPGSGYDGFGTGNAVVAEVSRRLAASSRSRT